MKHVVTVLLVIIVIAFGIYYAQKLQVTESVKTAGAAESKGDHKEALSQYVHLLYRTVPAVKTPDVNRSKALPPASWKKEMASYAVWSVNPASKTIDVAKKRLLIDAIKKNAALVDTQNFLIIDSVRNITPERYTALWNRAFFARGVTVDPDQANLAKDCYDKAISMIVVSAPTSFTYEMSLVDTQTNCRTSFTVYPEGSTYVLAGAGNTYLLVCESSYQPEPGKIWRSNPATIPVTVPPQTSLINCFVKTWVKKDAGKTN
jgi:hypothetical protein